MSSSLFSPETKGPLCLRSVPHLVRAVPGRSRAEEVLQLLSEVPAGDIPQPEVRGRTHAQPLRQQRENQRRLTCRRQPACWWLHPAQSYPRSLPSVAGRKYLSPKGGCEGRWAHQRLVLAVTVMLLELLHQFIHQLIKGHLL